MEVSKRQADDLAIAEENYKAMAISTSIIPHKNLKIKGHSRVEALLRHVRISSSRLKL